MISEAHVAKHEARFFTLVCFNVACNVCARKEEEGNALNGYEATRVVYRAKCSSTTGFLYIYICILFLYIYIPRFVLRCTRFFTFKGESNAQYVHDLWQRLLPCPWVSACVVCICSFEVHDLTPSYKPFVRVRAAGPRCCIFYVFITVQSACSSGRPPSYETMWRVKPIKNAYFRRRTVVAFPFRFLCFTTDACTRSAPKTFILRVCSCGLYETYFSRRGFPTIGLLTLRACCRFTSARRYNR